MPRHRIALGIGAASLLLAAASWGVYSLVFQGRVDAQSLRQVYRRREQLAAVLSLLKDARTSVDAGGEREMGSYAPTVSRLHRSLERLRKLIGDFPSQRDHLTKLEQLVAEELQEQQHAIEARRHDGDTDRPAPRMENEPRALEEIRLLIGTMNRLERARLRSGERRAQTNTLIALLMLAGGALAAFSILLAMFYRLVRGTAAQARVGRALSQRDAHFQTVTEGTHDAVITANAAGQITHANQAAGRMFHYDPEQLVGQPLTVLMNERNHEAHRRGLQRFLETGETKLIGKTVELEGLRRGNLSFPIELTLGSWPSENGPAFTGIIRDLDEQRQISDALDRSESRFRIVSELATDYAYSFAIDPQGRGIGEWVTDAFQRTTGYTPAEVDARGGGITLVHPDDLPVALQRLQRLVANQPDTSDYRIITKAGETRWVRDRGLPVWDAEQRRVVRAYGAVQDITEQRRAQEQSHLRQEELAQVLRVATIGEMSAGLAHEINQPLAAIVSYAKGCARRLRSGAVAADDLLRVVEEIAAQAIRADEIVRRLRDFARKGGARREVVDVNAVVQTVVNLISHEGRTRRVDIELDLTPDLPRVIADSVQIEQVILNLVRNAFEAMHRSETNHSRVTIRTRADHGESVAVSVSDSGHGFGALDPERAFEPFFTTKPNGLGIGLSISRSIVEAHGGYLRAESHDGAGVTMHFTLPVSNDADEAN